MVSNRMFSKHAWSISNLFVGFLIKVALLLSHSTTETLMAVISTKHFLEESSFRSSDQTLIRKWHLHIRCRGIHHRPSSNLANFRLTSMCRPAAKENRCYLLASSNDSANRFKGNPPDSPYINFRWLGGFLTSTVKQSIGRLQSFEEIAGEDGAYEGILKKKLWLKKTPKLERPEVRTMRDVRTFSSSIETGHLAVRRQKLGIPIVGIADTNCDPSELIMGFRERWFPCGSAYASVIATAVIEGRAAREKVDQRRTISRESEPAAPREMLEKRRSQNLRFRDKPKKPIVKYKKPKASESAKKRRRSESRSSRKMLKLALQQRLWKKLKAGWSCRICRGSNKLKQLLRNVQSFG